MLSLLRRWGARVFPSNSRARRRQAGSPLQGPPGTRPVRGLPPYAAPLLGRSVSLLLHSSVSLRLVYPGPLFLHTSAGKNPARSVPGSPGAGVPPAGADSVSLFRVRAAAQTATDCAGGTVPGLSATSLLPSFQQWAVTAQAPEAVCHPFAPASSAAPGSL